MAVIDLNCDMGESTGESIIGDDAGIMPYVSSVNIACGFHGGDPSVMHRTVLLAHAHGVAIGAHPSFHDPAGFGRREMQLDAGEIYDLVVYQVAALKGFASLHDIPLQHVKPHGALYNMAARNREYADAIARAVADVDRNLVLYGLSGSELIRAAENIGLSSCSEVFADRTYQLDGSLTPRTMPGAMIEDVQTAAAQVLQMVREQRVKSLTGDYVLICAETCCIHGDGLHAVTFARAIREALEKEGVSVKAFMPNR